MKLKGEDALQAACIQLFRIKYRDKIIFSIPNGARTSFGIACRLKATGLLKGIPDTFIPEPSKSWHGLFIEFKMPKGYLSQEQKVMLKNLEMKGYATEVCRSIDQFEEILEWYFDE